jgi:2'-5' RNA ligase
VRLFLAINPPGEVRREVDAAAAAMRVAAPDLSWIASDRIHLTLKFLGEQPDDRLDEIQNTLAAIAARHRELVMSVGGVGAFPNFRHARVVWIGVNPDPRLELLHHDVEMACERIGFPLEGRPFRPHITLARVKEALPEERLREVSRTAKATKYRSDFIARSIDLMRSDLTSAGPAYTTLVAAVLRSD